MGALLIHRRAHAIFWRALAATCAALALGVCSPALASAATNPGTVDIDSTGLLSYDAVPGQTNNVAVEYSRLAIKVTDTGATLVAGESCMQTDDVHVVLCPRGLTTAPDWSEIRYDFRLGNSNDLFIINVEASSGVSASGFVDGGEGNDLLIGGAGDDTILGGGGSDTIGGTAGTDTAVYLGNDSRTIDLDGAVGDDGGANDGSPGSRDTIASSINTVIAGGDGSDTITGNSQENLLYGGGGNDTVNGAGGYDQLYGDLPQVGLPADIWALTEASSDGADSLDGGAGNDVLHGAGGADDFVGGSGLDRVSYSDHEDAIVATIGGAADDGNSLDGLGGSRDNIHSDVEGIQGTSGDDTLTGGISNDFLDGDDGDDTLDGGDGNDLLHGGNGANSLDGGNGDDEFEASYFIEEADEYVGGAGTDTMSYAWRSEDPVTVTLDDIANDGTGAEADNVGSDIENIVGGSEDDVLVGSSAANRIAGGPGEDDITGADGDDNIVVGGFTGVYNDFNDDVVDAGDGDDRIYASADDTVDCGVGSDTASVDSGSPLNCETVNPPDEESSPSPGTVSIHHGTVHYTAEGGKANLVTVSSDSRYLTLVDTGATVTLTPGPGCVAGPNVQTVLCDLTVNWHSWNASLNLGDGNDSAVHTGASSWTTRTVAMNVVGGSGNDTITGGPDNDDIAGGTGADTLDGGDGTDLLSYRDHGWSVVVDFAVSGSEHGGSEDGSVGARDTIAGFEDIEGGLGSDTLVGNDYRNSLTGLAGNDTMSGNGGNDTLVGSEGTDSLSGGDDEDELDGGDDADVINGGAGADTVTYAERSQAVTINLGAAGSTQGSALDGLGGSRDTIQLVEHALGGQGNDTIAGSAAANLLDGGWGDDTINGSSGDDTIIGGDGQDTMLGGTGDDAVLMGSEFVPEGDSVSGGAGVDVADYSYRSAPVAIDLDDVADDGVVGEADNIRSDVEDVLGGYDVSDITGNASDNFIADGEVSSSDTISTLAGNDIVRMRYGGDAVDLGSGNDRVMARNGEVDTINCGPDLDVASVDQVADGDSVSDVLTGCENINPVSIKQVAGAGDTVQTSGSTSTEHPVALSLLSPNSGIVSMDESVVTQTQPEGMTFLAIQMDVTAPNATVTSPLRLTFTLDGSILPSSGEVQVFRDGVAATDCTGPSGHAIPDPCVESRTSISGGDLQLVVLSSHASLWNFGTPTPQISTPPSTTPESGAGGGGGAVDGGTDTGGKNPTADADTTAPTLKFALKPKQKLGRVLKSGLVVDATCSETCAVSARLRLDPKQAKKLKLSSDFGTVKVKRTGAGKLAIRWVMKNKARSRLKTGKSARFILELKATDAAGNVRTTRRAVTIKR